MKIKKGDMVVVIAGEDRSAVPRVVQQVIDGGKKVVIEGVNLLYRHGKRGHPQTSPLGTSADGEGDLRHEYHVFLLQL